MSNKRRNPTEEPVWKRRRREHAREERKSKLWLALVVFLICGALVFFVTISIVTNNRSIAKSRTAKPMDAIARVVDKRVVEKNGKTERWVGFRIVQTVAEKRVSGKDYNALRKNQEVIVSYTGDLRFGKIKILSWQPLKLMGEDQGDKKP